MKPLYTKKNGTSQRVAAVEVKMPASYPASRVTLTNGSSVEDIIGKASGSGLANSLVYREEITSITADMWSHIADGTFEGIHVGMHYTAASGRTYWFADADYFYGYGNTEQTAHHMLVIEDKINHTAQHQTSNSTTGGATNSLIYTTTLPSDQSEIETDFGAAHIKTQSILLSNAVSSGSPSGWAWANKNAQIMNARMVFGNPIDFSGNTRDMYNGGDRCRQLSLFRAMPETIIARSAADDSRSHWWLDDVESAERFGIVISEGLANALNASDTFGIRRAFIIG